MNRLRTIVIFLAILISSYAIAEDLNLTIIYDNNPYNSELETRWGFSCLVEGTEKTILFDVGGEGSVLLSNMEKLDINANVVDIVVLSHVHYDHVGGLPDLLRKNSNVTVYMPSSLPQSIKDEVKNANAELVQVHDFIKICKNVYSTGELGSFLKEQSLIITTSKGLVIITGCAHPGIVNIIKKVKKELKTDVYLVVGGFHLCQMNTNRIKGIINEVVEEGVMKVAPSHCSGDLARQLFEKVYGGDFITIGAGSKIKIDNAF